MARFTLSLVATAALITAGPAMAQFGSIFRDEPPRPPADVPSGTLSPGQAPYYRPQQPPYYPTQQGQRPPADLRDEPPSQPLPAPMSLPPSSRPGSGGIQSQDLAPPPGTEAPRQQQQPAQQQPAQPQAQPGEQQQAVPPPFRPSRGTGDQQQANTAPQPGDEVVVAPPPQRIANPTAVFAGLDKITGRIISFDVAIDETVQFGALQVTPRVCYSRPPTETPNTDSFVEVDEVTLQGEIKRIFTGWMFAASPGLHAVEHPIYDVWITDCKGGQNPSVAEAAPEEAKPPARSQQQRRTPPARQPVPQAQPRAQQPPSGFLPALR
ncbi:MAG: DUF2155 domain-containing protein [Pseudolabrys sp.]